MKYTSRSGSRKGSERIRLAFSTLKIATDGGAIQIFVHSRALLAALTTALGEIRAAMDAQDAADQVPSEMADWPVAAENELRAMAGDR